MMNKINPWSFPAVPSHRQIKLEEELKPAALLQRIERLEKEIKRLKKRK